MCSKSPILFIVCCGFIIQASLAVHFKEETCEYNPIVTEITKELIEDLGSRRTENIKKVPKNPTRRDFVTYFEDSARFAEQFEESASLLRQIPRTGDLKERGAFDDFFSNQTEIDNFLKSRVKDKQYFGGESFMIEYWEASGQNMLNLQNRLGKGKNKVADCYGAEGEILVKLAADLKKLKVKCVNSKETLKSYFDIVKEYSKKLNDSNAACKL